MPRKTRHRRGAARRRTRRAKASEKTFASLQGAEGPRPRRRAPVRSIPPALLKKYENISPFELKGALIKEAKGKHPSLMLNAGRGNPNFFNSYCRTLFARLQIAAVGLSTPFKKDLKVYPRLGYTNFHQELTNAAKGWPKRDQAFFAGYLNYLRKRAKEVGQKPNAIMHDVVMSTLGCFYPSPPRIQPHLSLIAKQFLHKLVLADRDMGKRDELPGLRMNADQFDMFATEGAAAGILYVFNTLKDNYILNPGDHIALITPIFSPYLEMPLMEGASGYGLKTVLLKGDPGHEFSLSKETIDKLRDPRIKALFMVNPGNPGAYSLPKQNIIDIGKIVNTTRKDLLVLSDNVYAPFAPKYYSFMASCPYNTIEVFSLSKYFGTTGWRLGLVMLSRKNRFNDMIARLSAARKKKLDFRYETASLEPRKLTFMQRLVLDSRQVAEAHVGGLSTPQQTILGLMLYYDMQDRNRTYQTNLRETLKTRITSLYAQVDMKPHIMPTSTDYYSLVYIPEVTEHLFGPAARDRLIKKYNYLEFLFHLARIYHVVLLPGSGFGADPWRVRVSLANLDNQSYIKIGKALRACIEDFVAESKK